VPTQQKTDQAQGAWTGWKWYHPREGSLGVPYGGLMKTKWVLEDNLYKLMSLCDSDTEIQIESMSELTALEKKLDFMGQLALIKIHKQYQWPKYKT